MKRRPSFLDGIGFLDAMLTSLTVISTVLIVLKLLHHYYMR